MKQGISSFHGCKENFRGTRRHDFEIIAILFFIQNNIGNYIILLRKLFFRVNPNSLSYPFPLVLHVHVRVRASSGFDRGVGIRGRGRGRGRDKTEKLDSPLE